MPRLIAVGILALAVTVVLGAQAPASPTFEVASVKPVMPDDQEPSLISAPPGGWFTTKNMNLRFVIESAYQIQDDQLIGGPDWLATDRFDIVARAGADASREQLTLRIQSLLADRFKLAVHRDTKELSVYALVFARADHRLGAGWKSTQCPEPEVDVKQVQPCLSLNVTTGRMMLRGATMTLILRFLAGTVSRVVVDRTGMNGRYDVDLEWSPALSGGGDPNRPSIFTAVQEQLGLRLESSKGPVDVLVIDHIERPTGN